MYYFNQEFEYMLSTFSVFCIVTLSNKNVLHGSYILFIFFVNNNQLAFIDSQLIIDTV